MHCICSASLRRQLGASGREYAERRFDIRRIADEFEGLLVSAAGEARVS